MTEIARISTPLSEAWPTWLMLGLLLCLVLSEVLQPDSFSSVFRSTFTRLERVYGDRARNFYGVLLLNTFRIGTVAMALYVFTYSHAPFSLLTYGSIILLIIAIILVKMLVSGLVSYTFELGRTTALFLPQYDNLWTILCLLLYPVTLLCINLESAVLLWVAIGIVALFVALMLYKIMQYFYAGPKSLLYLMIYVVTLELLPLGAIMVTTRLLT